MVVVLASGLVEEVDEAVGDTDAVVVVVAEELVLLLLMAACWICCD